MSADPKPMVVLNREGSRPESSAGFPSWSQRIGAVLRTTRWQLGLVPLGWWLWPILVVIAVGWSVLIANQILSLGRQPALNWVMVRTLAELQAMPSFLAAAVVLVDDLGRSRRSAALAMPWPGVVLGVRLMVVAGMAWAWAISVAGLIRVVLPHLVHDLTTTNLLSAGDAFGVMPIYISLFALAAGGVSALIGRFVPAVVVTVGGLGILLPMFAIFVPPARYLPGLAGLPPAITFDPSAMLAQPLGLAVLTAWAIGFSALALWRTTHHDR